MEKEEGEDANKDNDATNHCVDAIADGNLISSRDCDRERVFLRIRVRRGS